MKKIIIDAFQYSSNVTGTDRMAFNFLRELQKIDTKNKYYILCSREKYTSSVVYAENFKKIIPPLICSVPSIGKFFNYAWRKFSNLLIIGIKADVYYSFHNMSLPDNRVARKMIASNLDLIPIVLDEYKNLGGKKYEDTLNSYKKVSSMADKFISISNFSKSELVRLLGVDPGKIDVLYLAADQQFKPGDKSGFLKSDFILATGGSEPRKNVQLTIDAYMKLPQKIRNRYKLFICGGEWHNRKLKHISKKNNIFNLGFVADEELAKLYSSAAVHVFSSKYEGFGFNILESMASGVPVVCSKNTSLEEVGGSAPLYFKDLQNENDLSRCVELLLTDHQLYSKHAKDGIERASKFSWPRSAEQLCSIFNED